MLVPNKALGAFELEALLSGVGSGVGSDESGHMSGSGSDSGVGAGESDQMSRIA